MCQLHKSYHYLPPPCLYLTLPAPACHLSEQLLLQFCPDKFNARADFHAGHQWHSTTLQQRYIFKRLRPIGLVGPSMFFWLRKIFRYFSLYSLRTVAFYHVLVVAGKISKAISMDHTVSRSHSRWLWLEFEDSDLSQQNTNRSWEGKHLWFYFQVSQKITISYAKIICFKQYISVWQEKGCETLNKSNVLCTGWFNATVVLKPLWKAINCAASHLGASLAQPIHSPPQIPNSGIPVK